MTPADIDEAHDKAVREGKQTPHASDCALHNMPALSAGPCDCDARERAYLAAMERAGWVMAPMEATEEQGEAADGLPISRSINGFFTFAAMHGLTLPPPGPEGTPMRQWYRAMLAARPVLKP